MEAKFVRNISDQANTWREISNDIHRRIKNVAESGSYKHTEELSKVHSEIFMKTFKDLGYNLSLVSHSGGIETWTIKW